MGKVNQEMAEHGDMVMLPVSHSLFPEAEPRDDSFFPGAKLEGFIASSPYEVEEDFPLLVEGGIRGRSARGEDRNIMEWSKR